MKSALAAPTEEISVSPSVSLPGWNEMIEDFSRSHITLGEGWLMGKEGGIPVESETVSTLDERSTLQIGVWRVINQSTQALGGFFKRIFGTGEAEKLYQIDDGWTPSPPKRTRRAVIRAQYKGRGLPSSARFQD